jgi:hypothetical protein
MRRLPQSTCRAPQIELVDSLNLLGDVVRQLCASGELRPLLHRVADLVQDGLRAPDRRRSGRRRVAADTRRPGGLNRLRLPVKFAVTGYDTSQRWQLLADFFAVVTSLIAAVIGFSVRYAWDRFQAIRRRRGLGALLAGIDTPTMIVFPPREQVPEAILPRISTEDFLAINNLISAFLRIDRTPPSRLRDPAHLSEQDKKENNLIIICSSTRNPVTNEALTLLQNQDKRFVDLVPSFEEEPQTRRLRIRWNKGVYPSESFDQKGRVPNAKRYS